MNTILLLDDNHDMLEMTADMMRLDGYRVWTAFNGEEGVKLLAASPTLPDLIITDLTMPIMDGITFLQRLRANVNWANIPCAVMSGNPLDAQRAQQNGANAFLRKPFHHHEMEALLQSLLPG